MIDTRTPSRIRKWSRWARCLALATGLLATLFIAAPGGGYAIRIPEELPAKIAELTKEYHRAKIGQIAVLIDHCSEGESKLLVGNSASADPKVGMVVRGMAWGDIPFISICPVSKPVSVKLEGIGRCQLLGAVTTLVEANATGGDDMYNKVVAEPDVYLLAYGVNEGWMEEVRLIAVTVDDDGRRQLRVVLRTLAKRDETRGALAVTTGTIPNAVVEFPGADDVSNDNPAWRAHARLTFPEHVYRFSLDLRITMG